MKLLYAALFFSASYWMQVQGKGAAPQPQRVTQLRVRETIYLGQHRQYIISSDSIKVHVADLLVEGYADTAFARRISAQERDWLLSSMDKTYLSAIRPTYNRPSSIGHYAEYDVSLVKGRHTKATEVGNAKVGFFFSFCVRLNSLLPPAYHIAYPKTNFKH